MAPSPRESGSACSRCRSQAVSIPPPTIQRQQQLPTLMIGSPDNTPMNRAPKRTG